VGLGSPTSLNFIAKGVRERLYGAISRAVPQLIIDGFMVLQ
jgi:hypothetical protein